jgi:hypothetical protein
MRQTARRDRQYYNVPQGDKIPTFISKVGTESLTFTVTGRGMHQKYLTIGPALETNVVECARVGDPDIPTKRQQAEDHDKNGEDRRRGHQKKQTLSSPANSCRIISCTTRQRSIGSVLTSVEPTANPRVFLAGVRDVE